MQRVRLGWWAMAVAGTALNLALSFGTDLYRGDEPTAEEAAAARAVLSAADLGAGWTEEEADEGDNGTIGLTEGEAECLGVDVLQPDVERRSPYLSKGDDTDIRAVVGVWQDEAAAQAGHDAMARDDYPPCLVGQMREQQDGDRQDRAMVSLLGAGPAAADATVRRFSLLFGWSDGFTETFETYQAFKGRFQVVVFAWTPAGVDQAFAVDLVRTMLARVE